MEELWRAWAATGSEEASEALLAVRVQAWGKVQEALPIQDTQRTRQA